MSASGASPSRRPANRSVAASSAVALRADQIRSCRARVTPDALRGGASSRMACAFVPPIPKELTPARRGPASPGQGRSVVVIANGPASRASFGFAVSKFRLAKLQENRNLPDSEFVFTMPKGVEIRRQ